jgi:hypothetical protein
MASLRDGKVLSGAAAAWGGGMQKVVLKKPIAEELQPEEVVAADTLVADGEVAEHQQMALADIPQAELTGSTAAPSDLLALNTVQSLVDSTVQAAEPAAEGGASNWLLLGGAAVLGGGVAALAIADSDDNDDVAAPTPSDEVAVVVERTGAFIDEDADGVLDEGEDTAADFGEDGNADLANLDVTIQFNDVPETALNLTGFGTDDLLEFDVAALQENGVIVPYNSQLQYVYVNTGTKAYIEPGFSDGTDLSIMMGTSHYWGGVPDLAGNTYDGMYGLIASDMWSVVTGGSTGYGSYGSAWMAYWSDSGNALNSVANVLPDYSTGYGSSSNPTVVSHINAGDYAATYGGVVDFIFADQVAVVVKDDGAFLDTNADGVLGAGETTAAVFSEGGNADLAANAVTIHFHDNPTTLLDLSGFGGNDKLVVDLDAFSHGNTDVLLTAQVFAAVSSSSFGSSTAKFYTKPGSSNFLMRTKQSYVYVLNTTTFAVATHMALDALSTYNVDFVYSVT